MMLFTHAIVAAKMRGLAVLVRLAIFFLKFIAHAVLASALSGCAMSAAMKVAALLWSLLKTYETLSERRTDMKRNDLFVFAVLVFALPDKEAAE